LSRAAHPRSPVVHGGERHWLYQPDRGLTASPFYQFAESSLSKSLPFFPTEALTAVIEAQRSMYPVKHGLGELGAFPLLADYVKTGSPPSAPEWLTDAIAKARGLP
jgi:hypothetical protein